MKGIVLFFMLSTCFCEKVILLFGETRNGKSTFANKLAGANFDVGRYNDATSTTTFFSNHVSQPFSYPELFNGEDVVIIDVPGFKDTSCRVSDEEIMLFVKARLHQLGRQTLDGIIFFESLGKGTSQIRRYIKDLNALFGDKFKESTLLLITKGDVYSKPNQREGVITFCQGMQLDWMVWNNFDGHSGEKGKKVPIELPQEKFQEQLTTLSAKLSLLKQYSVAGMDELDKQIEKKANEIFQAQEPRTEVVEVPVEQDVAIQFFEEVEKSRPVTISGSSRSHEEIQSRATEIQQQLGLVDKDEIIEIDVPHNYVYYTKESYTTYITVHGRKRRGGIAGLFGGTKSCGSQQAVQMERLIEHMGTINLKEVRITHKKELVDIQRCIHIAQHENFTKMEKYTETEARYRIEKRPQVFRINYQVMPQSFQYCQYLAREMIMEGLRNKYRLPQ